MPIGERNAASAVVIGSWNVTPGIGGAHKAWVIEEIPVVNRIRVFVNDHPIGRWSGDLRKLGPLAVRGKEVIPATPCRVSPVEQCVDAEEGVHGETAEATSPPLGPLHNGQVRVGGALIDTNVSRKVGVQQPVLDQGNV